MGVPTAITKSAPFSETAVPPPLTVDGLVTGTRNRKSESISLQQRVGRIGGRAADLVARAERIAILDTRGGKISAPKTLDPETGLRAGRLGGASALGGGSARQAPSDGEQGWRLRSSPFSHQCGAADERVGRERWVKRLPGSIGAADRQRRHIDQPELRQHRGLVPVDVARERACRRGNER